MDIKGPIIELPQTPLEYFPFNLNELAKLASEGKQA